MLPRTQPFGDHLQRHGLSGSSGAGDEAMTIGELQRQVFRLVALTDENLAGDLGIGARRTRPVCSPRPLGSPSRPLGSA